MNDHGRSTEHEGTLEEVPVSNPELEGYDEPDEAPVVEDDETEGYVDNGGGGR